jgi:hypothetical protein
MLADVFFQLLEEASVKTVPPEPMVINIIEGEDWRALIMDYLHHYYELDRKMSKLDCRSEQKTIR